VLKYFMSKYEEGGVACLKFLKKKN
jgi:hypothetical protein